MIELIKSFTRQCLKLTPYELKRRREEKTVPSASFDNVRLVIAYYMASTRLATFVQVGACDGVSGDPVHDLIKKGRMRAVLIEPIEQSFAKLRAVYEGVPNVTTVQAAIGQRDGLATLYRVKEGASSIPDNWSVQLASFNKLHLLRHGVPADEIDEVTVPCLTLQSLVEQFGLERIDILQIDTEGFDAEIVNMSLDLPFVPECINFENVHLQPKAIQQVFERLKECGYVWTHDKWNTLALHSRLTARWTGNVIYDDLHQSRG
jgi:FkbM family methyltransferase